MAEELYIERNDAIINSKINRSFDELLLMSDSKFADWVRAMRDEVGEIWASKNVPPSLGFTVDSMLQQFRLISRHDTSNFLKVDELTYARDCIVPDSNAGSACRAFFPNMGKTKDITSTSGKGYSQWDYFTSPELFDSFLGVQKRHLKRDSYYTFSPIVLREDPAFAIAEKSGRKWIERFPDRRSEFRNFDFWLMAKTDNKRYKGRPQLTVSKRELLALRDKGLVKARHLVHADFEEKNPKRTVPFDKAALNQRYKIRLYEKDQKVFPAGFRFFQSGLVISGTNFPPLVAKHLYQRFTDDIKDQSKITIYDPSAGFGGRLLGALAAGADRQLHYIGTDPNSDNWVHKGMSQYEALARFYNRNIRQKHHTTYDLYKLGSEVIGNNGRFQEYRGKLDLVFTSPPYFAAEGYSDEQTQSYMKFPTYDEWRDGFLRSTLETAVEWLKPGRPLLWNIADTKIGGKYVPLEYDSKAILKSFGMAYEGKLKMVLARSPGGNRMRDGRYPETKNFCMVGGEYRKFEPVFVFRKLT